MENVEAEWEWISPLNLSIGFCNHDGLLFELLVSLKDPEGMVRGMPIGAIVQAKPEIPEDEPLGVEQPRMKFVSNKNDKEHTYRMFMSGNTLFFFKKRLVKRE